MKRVLFSALMLAVLQTACDRTPPAHEWAGKWNGPESTFLDVSQQGNKYTVKIQNLDTLSTYRGTRVKDGIEFERDGKTETIRAATGEQTGMKWLADKKDCLVIQTGEGFCRD